MLLSDYLFVLGKLKFSTQPHYPLSQTSTAGQAGYQLMHFWDDTSQLFPRMFDWLFQAFSQHFCWQFLQRSSSYKIQKQWRRQHSCSSSMQVAPGQPLTRAATHSLTFFSKCYHLLKVHLTILLDAQKNFVHTSQWENKNLAFWLFWRCFSVSPQKFHQYSTYFSDYWSTQPITKLEAKPSITTRTLPKPNT